MAVGEDEASRLQVSSTTSVFLPSPRLNRGGGFRSVSLLIIRPSPYRVRAGFRLAISLTIPQPYATLSYLIFTFCPTCTVLVGLPNLSSE